MIRDARQRRYYETHKEQLRAAARAHMAARRAKNRERVNAYMRAWRRANPDKQRANSRAAYLRNPEKAKAYGKAWRLKNPEKVVATSRAWVLKNRDKVRHYVLVSQARRKGAEGSYTRAEWLAKVAAFGGRCAYCGRSDLKLERDHVVPLSRGGSNYIDNIVPACLPCNRHKSTKMVAA